MSKRVGIVKHSPHWTEEQRDAVRALERNVTIRGFHRKGEIAEILFTIEYMQKMLKQTGARRCGRHYARACLRTLREMGMLVDTGQVLKPERKDNAHGLTRRWWIVWRVPPIVRAIKSLSHDPTGTEGPLSVSLRSFLKRQGFIRERCRFDKGSVQWAHHHSPIDSYG